MEIVGETKKNKSITGKLFLIIVILIIGVVVFRLFIYKKPAEKNQAKQNSTSASTDITEPTEAPTPTETETDAEKEKSATSSSKLKLNKYKIWILNGSGKAGEAKKLADLLADKGFNIIKTGNADNYDYENTFIKAKEKIEQEFTDKIKEELKDEYKIAKDENLEATESADVIIIIGKE